MESNRSVRSREATFRCSRLQFPVHPHLLLRSLLIATGLFRMNGRGCRGEYGLSVNCSLMRDSCAASASFSRPGLPGSSGKTIAVDVVSN